MIFDIIMVTGFLAILSFYLSLYFRYKFKKFGVVEFFRNIWPGFRIPPYYRFIRKNESQLNSSVETELDIVNRKRANIFLFTCYLLIVINWSILIYAAKTDSFFK
jgi:hypothetical protein